MFLKEVLLKYSCIISDKLSLSEGMFCACQIIVKKNFAVSSVSIKMVDCTLNSVFVYPCSKTIRENQIFRPLSFTNNIIIRLH